MLVSAQVVRCRASFLGGSRTVVPVVAFGWALVAVDGEAATCAVAIEVRGYSLVELRGVGSGPDACSTGARGCRRGISGTVP